MTLQTDKRDEALLEDIASFFDMLASDNEAMAARNLQRRSNLERAKVWRDAAETVRSIALV
jgi:hypothetical protein